MHPDRARTADPIWKRPTQDMPNTLVLVRGNVAFGVDDFVIKRIFQSLRDRDFSVTDQNPGRICPQTRAREPLIPQRTKPSRWIAVRIIEPHRRIMQSVHRIECMHRWLLPGHDKTRKIFRRRQRLRVRQNAFVREERSAQS